MILLSTKTRKTTPARRPHIETLFILVFARTRHRARGMSASPTRPRGLVPPPRRARSPRRPPARARAMSSESPGASPARPAFSSLPVLTLPPPGCSRAAEAAFAAELREVCHTVGFFVAGIDAFVSPTTRRDALAAATRFFAMPQDKKDAIESSKLPVPPGTCDRRGEHRGASRLAGTGRVRGRGGDTSDGDGRASVRAAARSEPVAERNRLPAVSRQRVAVLGRGARALSTRLTQLLALSLDLPADAFDGVFGDAPNVQMKIARYPPRRTASERTTADRRERERERE